LNCRFCEGEPGSQTHILEECQQINRQEDAVVKNTEIFEEADGKQMNIRETATEMKYSSHGPESVS